MIFASDLDRTLIYSKRACGIDLRDPRIQVVEETPERQISFMTKHAIELLRKVNQTFDLIPVSTRTVDLYNRIQLFSNGIVPKYAVVSNGGTILIDGQADEEWTELLTSRLARESAPHHDIVKKFEDIHHGDWVLGSKICDDLFCFASIQDEKVPLDVLQTFGEWLADQGWSFSLQEKKLYMLPNGLNKWAAVEYLKQKLAASTVITAGDSLLDVCMLEVADYAFTPLHGEINEKKMKLPSRVKVTSSSGIYAGEEILESVLEIASRKAV
ncbi:hydroxymethylpyrimidine pyrophosphatase-like HAD family hydrolase [Peribacillus deserti]|uniref:Hydroxymethylpyrimidine pyrophosphatase-like HAD family hydrolase n=1 Tax=Peribacillus deserti TaxID=673318 RepID=A0ABS2QCN8_9BACI|nr:HAD family hydrolase [Peribacillus deserti]MBM7690922.1 hydroxymethylpyrimidine pyrophosphatase-like HAD family hydrolase [Peribacillus deserti]